MKQNGADVEQRVPPLPVDADGGQMENLNSWPLRNSDAGGVDDDSSHRDCDEVGLVVVVAVAAGHPSGSLSTTVNLFAHAK